MPSGTCRARCHTQGLLSRDILQYKKGEALYCFLYVMLQSHFHLRIGEERELVRACHVARLTERERERAREIPSAAQ